MAPQKFLEHTVILCFERRYPKQNRCYSPEIKHFGPPKIFRLAMLLFPCLEKRFPAFYAAAQALVRHNAVTKWWFLVCVSAWWVLCAGRRLNRNASIERN